MDTKNSFYTKKVKQDFFQNIPSFKYRHYIKRFSKSFYQIPNFAGTSIAVLLRSGDVAWLSTIPKTTVKHVASGLYRGNLLLNYRYLDSNRVIFPHEFNEVDKLQSDINQIFKLDNLYKAYCIVRICQDCLVMITCNVTQELNNLKAFYETSIDMLESRVNDFLDNTIDIYAKILPAFSNCRFAKNNFYRHKIITTRHIKNDDIHLSHSECDVLYWSAQGKSANEIAAITGLTKNTIDTYRQRLTQKLNAKNITQAVYLAKNNRFII